MFAIIGAFLKPYMTVRNIIIAAAILAVLLLFGGYKYYKYKADKLATENRNLTGQVQQQETEATATGEHFNRVLQTNAQTSAISQRISEARNSKPKPSSSKPTVSGGDKKDDEINWKSVVDINNSINSEFALRMRTIGSNSR